MNNLDWPKIAIAVFVFISLQRFIFKIGDFYEKATEIARLLNEINNKLDKN